MRATISEARNPVSVWPSLGNAVGSNLTMSHLQQGTKLICIHLLAY